MVAGAEETTGPVLAKLGDERVLRFGRLLRKSALDELPANQYHKRRNEFRRTTPAANCPGL